jgi:hypothetical protein
MPPASNHAADLTSGRLTPFTRCRVTCGRDSPTLLQWREADTRGVPEAINVFRDRI